MLTYLLDTGWIIRHLRGGAEYTAAITRLGSPAIGISVLSIAELYEGVYRASDRGAAERAVLTFVSDKTILPITSDICRVFGEQRAALRQHNALIGDVDLLLAATCIVHRLTVLTTNPRHFERVPRPSY